MKPSRRAKQKSIVREVRVLFFCFGLFTEVAHLNEGDMPKEYLAIYSELRSIVDRYYWRMKHIVDEVNAVMMRHTREREIDLMLASISAVAFYYEHLKGKRTFSPMSHKTIMELQCSMLDIDFQKEKETLDFTESVVKDLLAL